MVNAQLDVEGARRLVTMSVDHARRIVEGDALSLAERRVARARRGSSGQRARCGACNAFLRSTAHPCKVCGYLDGRGFAA